jgi:putative N6-adenine-specific DNA methylase
LKAHKKFDLFAVTLPGLEDICAGELKGLHLEGVMPRTGGVEFRGGLYELYQANLWLRTATRVLVRVGLFKCRDFPALYKKTMKLPWGRFIRPGSRVRVEASSHDSRLMHSDRISETVWTAIIHSLGGPPTAPEEQPQSVLVRLTQDQCLLSVDSSGELLHRRGYREFSVAAPLRETLAAGILQLFNWNGERPLLDPMCGSGTFPIEAALLTGNRPPGKCRHFAFMHWPHYRHNLWNRLLEASQDSLQTPSQPIFASDKDARAVTATRHNAAKAGVGDDIQVRLADLAELKPDAAAGLLLCNPPYGRRLSEHKDSASLYREMGAIWRQNFSGWILGLVCPPRLAKATGLPMKKMGDFSNGGIKIQAFKVLL